MAKARQKRVSAASSAMAAARAKADMSVVAHAPVPQVKQIPHHTAADAEITAAKSWGAELRKAMPRIASASYDRKRRLFVVTFTNGATFSFPPALVRGFSTATADQLSDVEVRNGGKGLHWEALDTDLTAGGLFGYVFGKPKAQARWAGKVNSPAKAAAAKANSAKGGRPRASRNREPG